MWGVLRPGQGVDQGRNNGGKETRDRPEAREPGGTVVYAVVVTGRARETVGGRAWSRGANQLDKPTHESTVLFGRRRGLVRGNLGPTRFTPTGTGRPERYEH